MSLSSRADKLFLVRPSFRKVGILSIQGDQFDIEPVALKTVRPFKIGEVIMEEEADDPANELDLQSRDSVTAFLEKKVGLTAPSR